MKDIRLGSPRRAAGRARVGLVAVAVVTLIAACTGADEDDEGEAGESPAADGTASVGDKWCSDVSIAAFPPPARATASAMNPAGSTSAGPAVRISIPTGSRS